MGICCPRQSCSKEDNGHNFPVEDQVYCLQTLDLESGSKENNVYEVDYFLTLDLESGSKEVNIHPIWTQYHVHNANAEVLVSSNQESSSEKEDKQVLGLGNPPSSSLEEENLESSEELSNSDSEQLSSKLSRNLHNFLSGNCIEPILENEEQRLMLHNPESSSEVENLKSSKEELSSDLKQSALNVCGIKKSILSIKRIEPALDSEEQLYFAVLKRDSEKVEELLKYCHGTFKDQKGNTLLHIYATRRITESLIKNTELDLNSKNNIGFTPLHMWIMSMVLIEDDIFEYRILPENFRRHYEILNFLLDAGADCNIKESKKGNTVLHDAIFVCLLSNTDLPEEQWISLVQLLFSFRADPNIKNNCGRTLLHKAVDLPYASLVRLLIQYGSRVNAQDNFGKTPFHELINHAHYHEDDYAKEMTVLMMENGADPTIQDEYGRTALHFAVLNNNEKLVYLLLQFEFSNTSLGPKINNSIVHIVDKNGLNALHHGVGLNRNTIAKLLITHGSDLNAVDKYGSSCLHYAAYNGNLEMIKLLKESGGNPELADKNGNTPATFALRRNYFKTVAALQVETGQILHTGFLFQKDSFEEETDRVMYSLKLDQSKRELVEFPDSMPRINFNEDSKKSLRNVMEVEGVGRLPNVSEVHEIRKAIEAYMNELTKCMSFIDGRFKGKTMKSGSVYEGTKVGDPDEFDYMFILTEFEKICSINLTDETYDDVIIKKDPNKSNDEFDEYFQNNNLKCSSVMRKFVGVYREAQLMVNYKSFHDNLYVFHSTSKTDEGLVKTKPGITTCEISFVWCGAFYKYLVITADLVPAIRVKTWPRFAETESELLTRDIIRQGCHVVQKSDKWRLSFSLAEQTIMNKLSGDLRSAYIEAKVARDPRITLATAIRLEREMEIENKTTIFTSEKIIDGRKLIPSYLLKLVLFDCIEESHKNGRDTSEITSAMIFSKLNKCLQDNISVPFFFMKKYNFLNKVFNEERPYEQVAFAVSVIDNFFKLESSRWTFLMDI